MYLFGASGHGKVIAEIAEQNDIKITAFIDMDISKIAVLDYPVIHDIPNNEIDLIISIGNNKTRKQIVEENKNFSYSVLSHPFTTISKRAILGDGTVIMAGAVINSNVTIGRHCIINTCASIDHDCIIGDFVHVSPNAVLAGNVLVGEGTHIGIGASIIPGVRIGKWCIIGAGAVIIKDISDGSKVVGNPGKNI